MQRVWLSHLSSDGELAWLISDPAKGDNSGSAFADCDVAAEFGAPTRPMPLGGLAFTPGCVPTLYTSELTFGEKEACLLKSFVRRRNPLDPTEANKSAGTSARTICIP